MSARVFDILAQAAAKPTLARKRNSGIQSLTMPLKYLSSENAPITPSNYNYDIDTSYVLSDEVRAQAQPV